MRSSGIPTKLLRHALALGAASRYCPSHVMVKWCQDLQLHDIVDRPYDPRGQFHGCVARWSGSVSEYGLRDIVTNSDLVTWIGAGLTTDVMIGCLPEARERVHDLAAYLVLLRQLNIMEYWASVVEEDPRVYHRLLRVRDFWVNPETGYGPLQATDFDQSAAKLVYTQHSLYPHGLRTMDLVSFQPIGTDLPIMVPFKEPAEPIGDHVLVLVTDIDKFMPFINSRWLDEYGD